MGVDANDGSSDFLLGRKGSAISVGRLLDATPSWAWSMPQCWPTVDCIAWAESSGSVRCNGAAITLHLPPLKLAPDSQAVSGKPAFKMQLCAPADFAPMPSIAYRLARLAAGDAVAEISLVPVSAHDEVGECAMLISAQGVLLGQGGPPLSYSSLARITKTAFPCFGAVEACQDGWGPTGGVIHACNPQQAKGLGCLRSLASLTVGVSLEAVARIARRWTSSRWLPSDDRSFAAAPGFILRTVSSSGSVADAESDRAGHQQFWLSRTAE